MHWLRGIGGAVAGAVAGYFLFSFLLGSGFYAMLLPGALVGLGCSWSSKIYSVGLGMVAGCLALGLSVFLEWYLVTEFVEDNSLGFFLANMLELGPASLLMMVGGGFLGFWFGKGRPELKGRVTKRSEQATDE